MFPAQSAPIKDDRRAVLLSDFCIGATVSGNAACVNVPPFGNLCVPIPVSVPNGASVQACASICTKWGFIPTGACVSAYYNGQQVGGECWGSC
jgi:hypothetical protein